jgi:hypothetical protein
MFYRSSKVKFKITIPNGRWCMHSGPAPADRGRDEDPASGVPEPVEYESVAWEPVVTCPDPMSEADQQALLDAVTDDGAVVAAGGRPGPRRPCAARGLQPAGDRRAVPAGLRGPGPRGGERGPAGHHGGAGRRARRACRRIRRYHDLPERAPEHPDRLARRQDHCPHGPDRPGRANRRLLPRLGPIPR